MFLFILFSLAHAQTLEKDALPMVEELKMNLVGNLKKELSNGPVKALEFCHLNAEKLTREQRERYSIGRTSHKVRNPKNIAPEWMKSYFDKFAGTQKGALPMSIPLYHTDENGKRTWFAPIYTEAMCLQCHGEKLSAELTTALKKYYPKDQATGFKAGEFRGFFWVKEK